MDALETKAYIEHRLNTVGWRGEPVIQDEAFPLIHEHSSGIPRKINTLCDRMLIMGYLDELHSFGVHEVNEVIQDIQQEFDSSDLKYDEPNLPSNSTSNNPNVEQMDERLNKMEKSVISVLDLLKQVLSLSSVKSRTEKDK
jgi:vacuolar-type H+-ATPase subunit I/STV1